MLKKIVVLLFVTVLSANGLCADLILNEYNAVAQEKYLETDNYGDSNSVDLYFQSIADGNHPDKITGSIPNGRLQGNGSDWIEFVVIKDHLDIRNWQIRWAEVSVNPSEASGTDIWYGNGNIEQGILQFSNNTLWSNLRAGTIITIVETDYIYVDTENGNRTYNVGPSYADAIINVDTDVNFDPNHGDWWINVSVKGESGRANPLVTSVHNVLNHASWDFGVGNNNWQAQINNAAGTLVFGPVGEAIPGWGGGGVNSNEVGRVEANPSASITVADFDDAHSSSFGMPNVWGATTEVTQNFMTLRSWLYTPADCNAAIGLGFGSPFDFNHDCYVNLEDFASFAQNWLSCMNPNDPHCSKPWLHQ